jgi:diacylglycerol kinase family enzyme
MNLLSAKEVHVTRSQEGPMHIDGDPIHMPQELHLRIVEDGLNLLVEKRF